MESHKPSSFLLIPLFSLLLFHSFPLSHSILSRNPFQEIPPTSSPDFIPPPPPESQSFGAPNQSPLESELQLESESLQSIPDPNPDSTDLLDNVSGTSGRNPALDNLCQKTDYPDLCTSTVSPSLKGNSDIYTVVEQAMESATEVTKMGLLLAKRLSTMPGTPKEIAAILKNCKDSYEEALYNFEEARTALSGKDYGRMNAMLSAVITYVGDCSDEFSGQPSPLTTYDDKVTKMTSNCLAMVDLLPEFPS